MRVLFVCTGNICRSPTAEAVFRYRAAEAGISAETDSAGTHDYHVGNPPDPRSIQAAAARGIEMNALRARQVAREDYDTFDLIVALDTGHLEILERERPGDARAELCLLMDFASGIGGGNVPDPYYGGEAGFEHVLDLIEAGVSGIIADISRRP